MKPANEAMARRRRFGRVLPALLLLGGLGLASARPVLSQGEGTTLQFSQAVYEGDEDQEFGAVTVRVTRIGDLSGASRVAYSTQNGTATAGQDYEAASGTLNFGAGDASAEFFVILGEDFVDQIIEPTETVRLVLSNPVGATLGPQSEAALQIRDTGIRTAPRRIAFNYRGTTATIRWTDDSDNERRFRIERRDGGGAFRTVATRPADSTEFVNTGLREGQTYTYRVRAELGDLASGWSPEITFRVGEASQESFRLRISKRRLKFGNVRVGREKRQSFKVRNVGRRALTVRVGGAAEPFEVSRGGGDTVLQPGETFKVAVRFTPTSRGTFEDRMFVAIVLRDGELSGRNVRLRGRGR